MEREIQLARELYAKSVSPLARPERELEHIAAESLRMAKAFYETTDKAKPAKKKKKE